jgi:hypothetical protein
MLFKTTIESLRSEGAFCSECWEPCAVTLKRLGAAGFGLFPPSRNNELVHVSSCCQADTFIR